MKPLTILFESPNVFKVLPDKPHCMGRGFCCYGRRCDYLVWEEQSKVNAVRIENHALIYDVNQHGNLLYFGTHLKPGDIFQVEGFEYELETRFTYGWIPTYNNPDNSGCNVPAEPYEVAILKLAKEEEPKEQDKSQKLIETLVKINKALDLIDNATDLQSAKLMVNDIQEIICFVLDKAKKS